MKSVQINTNPDFRTLSFWMTFIIAAGIIFIGARFIINPSAGADGFGIPISHPNDLHYGKIKGIRDIFSGVVLLLLLFLNMPKAVFIVLTAAIIIPATDFLIVLSANGASDIQHLLIHGATVIYMGVNSLLLFRDTKY